MSNEPPPWDDRESLLNGRTLGDAARERLREACEAFGLSGDLVQVALRRVTNETGHRDLAADLLIMDAIDECEGNLIDDSRWLVRLATVGARMLMARAEWDPSGEASLQ